LKALELKYCVFSAQSADNLLTCFNNSYQEIVTRNQTPPQSTDPCEDRKNSLVEILEIANLKDNFLQSYDDFGQKQLWTLVC
jgi:hypothetical protein